MASILAGYSDIPEETATKMLANDLLIEELTAKRTDEEFEQTVESALAKENAILMEERAALERQLEQEKSEKEAKQQELTQTSKVLREREDLLNDREQALNEKERTIQRLETGKIEQGRTIQETTEQMERIQREKQDAERRADVLQHGADAAARSHLRTMKIASIVTGSLLAAVFFLFIHYVHPWHWLLDHPNGYGLQGCLGFMIFFGTLGAWVKPWRKTFWMVGVLGVLFVFLQILGGPMSPPSP
jgi:membrane-associated HD superfamily phosphohydrolase